MIDLLILSSIFLFSVSITISVYRMMRGPTMPDRMLALDVVTYGLSVVMALVAVLSGSPYLIVISFSLALWFFIGSLYVAKYMEGKQIDE